MRELPSGRNSMDAGKREGHERSILLLVLILLGAALAWSASVPPWRPTAGTSVAIVPPAAGQLHPSAALGTYFDYLLIIMMENHAICSILTSCGGSAPYMTGLANAYGLATKDVKCTTPSLPNYLCITGGSDFGCTGYDGAPHSNTCTNVAWNSPNIVDRFVGAGLTWKAYMENMPSNCSISTSGQYAVKHDGFVYYSDNVLNATRCSRIIPAGTNDAALLHDLASTSTASNYMWLTPNLCNDMHDCSVATGDTYLKGLVPQILNSTLFQTTRAALLVTFDEDSGTSGAPYIYTVWAGPVAKTAYTSANAYNHYSVLKTIETNWNLVNLTSNDKNAASMGEFFGPSAPGSPTARFTTSPTWPKVNQTVTFNATASSDPNPTGTLQYRWDWTNDGTFDTAWSSSAVATHVYAAAGSYVARLEVQDTSGLTGNATGTVKADSEPPVTTSTLTGTSGSNGWYRSSVAVKLTATDDLSGVAAIHYRKDGGSWATYSSQLSLSGDGTHTVDDYAVDNAGNIETTHSVTLKIDTVAPSTSASLQGTLNGTYYQGTVNVTLTASDATSGVASTKYRVDNGSWLTYASSVSVGGNGTHSFDYYSTDSAGNTETTKTVSFPIGAPPSYPVTSIVLTGTIGNGGWYRSSVTVALNATDPAGNLTWIEYRLDSGVWVNYTSSFSVPEGMHLLEYNATDAAGRAEPTHMDAINVDAHPPTSAASLAGDLVNGSYNGAVSVSLSATDALSGVAATAYRVDGGAWRTYAASFSVSGNGTHRVDYNSTDHAGNAEAVRSTSFSIQIIVVPPSSAPPETSVAVAGATGSEGWYVTNATVTVNATDPSGGSVTILVSVDNGSWKTYAGPLVLANGRHLVRYDANDTLGHTAATKSVVVNVDTTPPDLRVLGPSGTVTSSSVTITWQAQDLVSGVYAFEVSLDNGPFLNEGKATEFVAVLSDGSHTAAVRAVDAAGNAVLQAVAFHVDTNVFSPSGPYQGVPLYFALELGAAVVAGVAFLALRRRRRRMRRQHR